MAGRSTVAPESRRSEEVGYILAGTVEMSIEGMPTLTLKAGDPFLMPPTYIVGTDEPLATFTRTE